MAEEENARKTLKKQPTWELIDKDLSGPELRRVFLWYMRGEGKAVLTDLQISLSPPEGDRRNTKKMESRYRSMRSAGTWTRRGRARTQSAAYGMGYA